MNRLLILVTICALLTPLFGQSDTSIVYLGSIDSTIVQDVKYATTDNFTKTVLYPTAKVYLRKNRCR